MVKNIKSLDLSTDFDLIYFYKNICEYAEHLHLLSAVRVTDVTTGMICYGFVEAGVLDELGLGTVDREMVYLMDDNNSRADNRNAPGTGGVAGCNDIGDGADGIGGSTNVSYSGDAEAGAWITGAAAEIAAGTISSASSTTARSCDSLFVSNLPDLLSPFLRLFDKQVVDMIFFVYKRTGISHFEMLFREHEGSKDLLIELHLLVARGSKGKTFDFSDIKETLGGGAACSSRHDSTATAGGTAADNAINIATSLPSSDIAAKSDEVDFFENVSDDSSSGGNINVEIGCFTNSSLERVRPFALSKSTNPMVHLDQAKQLLISMNPKDQSFYVESVSTFLSIRFDRTLFLSYVRAAHNYQFYRSLSKFKEPPFFFYKDVNIKYLLAESNINSMGGRARRRGISKLDITCDGGACGGGDGSVHGGGSAGANEGVGSSRRNSINSKLTNANAVGHLPGTLAADSTDTYKHVIVCNAYTLRYFIEFAMSVFSSYSGAPESYLIIARYLRYFVGHYRHLALFRILEGLLENRIDKVYEEVCECILEDIELYVDVFYNDRKCDGSIGEGCYEVFLDDALCKEWSYGGGDGGQGKNDAAGASNGDTNSSIVDADAGTSAAAGTTASAGANPALGFNNITINGANASDMKIPTFDSSDDDLVYYFNHPNVLRPIDRKLSDAYLSSFYQQRDRRAALDNFLVESSKYPNRKIYILNSLKIFEHLENSPRRSIVDNICNFSNSAWRYRASLINRRKELIGLGVAAGWFEKTFASDKVYFIRRMVKAR